MNGSNKNIVDSIDWHLTFADDAGPVRLVHADQTVGNRLRLCVLLRPLWLVEQVQVPLIVELWRGDDFRDRATHHADLMSERAWERSFRVHFGRNTRGSSRLVARLIVEEQIVAKSQVVVANVGFDSQGRMVAGSVSGGSPATRIAYADELRQLLRDSGSRRRENGGPHPSNF